MKSVLDDRVLALFKPAKRSSMLTHARAGVTVLFQGWQSCISGYGQGKDEGMNLRLLEASKP
jgi:hypothetical protein